MHGIQRERFLSNRMVPDCQSYKLKFIYAVNDPAYLNSNMALISNHGSQMGTLLVQKSWKKS